jgi:hypothetical protein
LGGIAHTPILSQSNHVVKHELEPNDRLSTDVSTMANHPELAILKLVFLLHTLVGVLGLDLQRISRSISATFDYLSIPLIAIQEQSIQECHSRAMKQELNLTLSIVLTPFDYVDHTSVLSYRSEYVA